MPFSRQLVHSKLTSPRRDTGMLHETYGRVRLERPAALLFAVAAFAACLLPASGQPLKSLDRPQFRADTNLILVPITVTDGRGSSIRGLSAESFTVLDNRLPQPIVAFYSEDAPSSIGIVLDVSGSTRGILDQEKAAVRAFLQFSNPEDDFFLRSEEHTSELQSLRHLVCRLL